MPWRIGNRENKENKQGELYNSLSLLPGEGYQGAGQGGATEAELGPLSALRNFLSNIS